MSVAKRVRTRKRNNFILRSMTEDLKREREGEKLGNGWLSFCLHPFYRIIK